MEVINVLLVDDDECDRKLVQLALKNSTGDVKFNIKEASSFSKASDLLGSETFDVVLLDLHLPDSSGGIETVRDFREINNKTPVVVLTGLDDVEFGINAIKNGADDYVSKDVTPREVLIRSIIYSIERKKTEKIFIQAKEEAEKLQQETMLANNDNKPHIECREKTRLPIYSFLHAQVTIWDDKLHAKIEEEKQNRSFNGILLNISMKGAQVLFPSDFVMNFIKNQNVRICLKVTLDYILVELNGQIKYIEPDEFFEASKLGLEFTDLDTNIPARRAIRIICEFGKKAEGQLCQSNS